MSQPFTDLDPSQEDERPSGNPILVFLEETLPGLLLGLLVSVVCIEVVARYVFDSPLAWTKEAGVILFMWQVMLAVGGVARRKMNMAVEILPNRLAGRPRTLLKSAGEVISILILGTLAYLAFDFATSTGKHLQLTGLSYQWVYLAAAIGFSLACIHSIAHLITAMRGLR